MFFVIVSSGAAWSVTAIWLNLDGLARAGALGLLGSAVLATLFARFRRRRLGWAALGLSALGVVGWYQTIEPRDDRNWAFDVARGVKAEVTGDQVTLRDLRDFDWQTQTIATERWITKDYDLNQLQSVDMLTSVWDSPDIAHLLVSFGFSDGERVVFSVEIRRELGEDFSQIGGFFRQFELVLIAATEQDIVRLRTDKRREQVRLFPVDLTQEQMRTMFMSYVELAQELDAEPRFYNTIAANCTTVVYGLARSLKSDLPLRKSLILSGRLPEYLDDLGVLGGEGSLADRQASALIMADAQERYPEMSFSQAIRAR
ncbi:DUF4105 domain-containing protein [Primorskyibacter aestuariivivens]|uniref:Lnb N-terminal periplasmic domain-containing protein n=1 Tax=Primorskyibacter aestuariivivens TaxID=1888912 RepID=UPI0023010784|nr:DUF4105 domain-containing protein [Primorskyibacter aestuariivivens]MDA7428486.1 DUF4105 domain-containing protein [Primorskyibacter aestuariivivens]